MVEQWTENPRVESSILSLGTMKKQSLNCGYFFMNKNKQPKTAGLKRLFFICLLCDCNVTPNIYPA